MDGTAQRDRAKVCFSLRRDGHDCRRLIRTRGEMEWGKEIEEKKERGTGTRTLILDRYFLFEML